MGELCAQARFAPERGVMVGYVPRNSLSWTEIPRDRSVSANGGLGGYEHVVQKVAHYSTLQVLVVWLVAVVA